MHDNLLLFFVPSTNSIHPRSLTFSTFIDAKTIIFFPLFEFSSLDIKPPFITLE